MLRAYALGRAVCQPQSGDTATEDRRSPGELQNEPAERVAPAEPGEEEARERGDHRVDDCRLSAAEGQDRPGEKQRHEEDDKRRDRQEPLVGHDSPQGCEEGSGCGLVVGCRCYRRGFCWSRADDLGRQRNRERIVHVCQARFEYPCHLGRGWKPGGGILGEEPGDDARQPGRHVGIGEAHVGRLDVGHHPQHRMARLGAEWRATCGHREQHGAERKQIAAGVDRLPEGLLRRHEMRRAGQQAGDGEAGVVGGAGEAEVGEEDAIDAIFKKDVGRLHIAVDEPLGVRRGQAARRLQADAEDLAEVERPAVTEALGERRAAAVGHDEIGKPVGFAHPVNRDHGVVNDPRRGAGFAQKALPRSAAGRQMGLEDLDGDEAVEGPVVPLEHDPHPAGADDPSDLVGPKPAEHRVVVGGGKAGLDRSQKPRGQRPVVGIPIRIERPRGDLVVVVGEDLSDARPVGV